LSCKTVAAGNSAYFTCPETSLVISKMLTLLLATKDNFQRVIGVDQSPLLLVLQLVLLDISSTAFLVRLPRGIAESSDCTLCRLVESFLECFVAAAEELNFTHAADRLHVSQPPFSKQIHDLEGELGINLFERVRKGVALTPAGKSFLIDARRILEDCETSIRKAQRISRGEIGELAIGYISALTHEFLGKALEVWRLTSPGIIVDCIEMDSVSQERAPLDGIYLAAFSIGRLRGTPQTEQKAHVLYDSWHRRFCGWA
jgi:hypothetical protein